MPELEPLEIPNGDAPTVNVLVFPNEPVSLVINGPKPASKNLKKNQQLLNKTVVEAILRVVYTGNDIREFNDMVDDRWNSMC